MVLLRFFTGFRKKFNFHSFHVLYIKTDVSREVVDHIIYHESQFGNTLSLDFFVVSFFGCENEDVPEKKMWDE